MGKQSLTLQDQHARSLFIGKPVVHKSSMARLGVLRYGDLRCLSATFMVVVFFCCVVLLSLQPSQYASKYSMVDLPKDEVVRFQSISALAPAPTPDKNSKHNGSGKDGKKNSKNDQKANKKASKAKWIKDELPKKLHTEHVRNNSKSASKVNGLDGAQNTDAKPHTDGGPFDVVQNTDAKPSEFQPKITEIENVNGTNAKNQPAMTSVDEEPPPPELVKVPQQPSNNLSSLSDSPLKTFKSPFIEVREKGVQVKAGKKTIAWYKAQHVRGLNSVKKMLEACPKVQCKLLNPVPSGVQADAVVFTGVDRHSVPPARSHNDQVFVLHDMSPPPSPLHGLWPQAWNSVFNWTWSYRHDSDIWQPLGLLKTAKRVKGPGYFENLTKSKTRAVAWIPRSCPVTTQSKRNEFIEELRNHVHISEFGPCSNKSCARAGISCSETLTKKFFFLLAIEDDICKDHVTEVFYRTWQEKTYVVPIVRGGADYASYFPDGTYVDADWFDSAKELAEFMAKLMANRKTYSQLLWRKAHWIRASKHVEQLSLCTLCYKLHSIPSSRKSYSNILKWYESGQCTTPNPF